MFRSWTAILETYRELGIQAQIYIMKLKGGVTKFNLGYCLILQYIDALVIPKKDDELSELISSSEDKQVRVQLHDSVNHKSIGIV